MLKQENLGIKDYIVFQDSDLYKFTSDAILLSHFASVKKNDCVADFCAGSGIIGFNLYALHETVIKNVTLFEMQKDFYHLSCKTIEKNNWIGKIISVNSKIQDIGKEYEGKFSLIVCNPPYMESFRGFEKKEENIAVCTSEITLTLSELCSVVSKSLKFGGRFALCHRADRLCDVIREMQKNHIEPKRLQFVYSSKRKSPYLILLEGVKGGKSGVEILENIKN